MASDICKAKELDKAALGRFLADNPELEELSAKLATFNIFRTLKIEKMEIRHSNVLAWLLNPTESHGLKDTVLRRLLSNMLLENKLDGISAADVELMLFDDIEIRREWKHIDVLVIDYTNKLAIIIENKIHAAESEKQLSRHKEAVAKEFIGFKLIPIFLTLCGDDVCDEDAKDYICYSHIQVLSILEKLVSQRASQLSEPVRMFLTQYLDTLRRLTMQDESLVKLCKTIYQRHREAIDLIMEYGATGAGQSFVEEFLNKDQICEIISSNANRILFIPKPWAKYVPENSTAPLWQKHKKLFSVGCFIRFSNPKQQVELICEVSSMPDPDLRMATVTALKNAGFKLKQEAFRKDAVYSRFFSKRKEIGDMTDTEEIGRAVKTLYAEFKPQITSAEQVFKEVFDK
jgi:hypothetical protein